jgi:processive 1,2-diacylglycerol beta-glucosyltransferase
MKVLVIYATAGAGHRRAAEAIYNAAVKTSQHNFAIIDSLDYTNPLFKKIYSEGYRFLISKFPWLWGIFYYSLDNPFIYSMTYPLRKLVIYLNSRRLADYINIMKPDIIVSTQFFANEVISIIKKQGLINPKLICVVTDFRLHSIWLSEAVDLYIVASEKTKKDLISRKVPESKIRVLGIPVDSKFLTVLDKSRTCAKLGIDADKFTVLIMTGGFGIGPIATIVERLKRDVQMLVVCGRNRKLYNQLKNIEI